MLSKLTNDAERPKSPLPKHIDLLAIDAQGLLYTGAVGNLENPNEFKAYILEAIRLNLTENPAYIQAVALAIASKARIEVTFDGIPPLAKIVGQKMRRLIPSATNLITATNPNMPDPQFEILPVFRNIFGKDCFVNIVMQEPGEGEHLLFRSVRKFLDAGKPDATVLLMGGDSDIFVMSGILAAKYMGAQISTIAFAAMANQTNNTLHMKAEDVLGISKFGLADTPENRSTLAYQLVLRGCLMGNDFLPTHRLLGIDYDPSVRFEMRHGCVVDPVKIVQDAITISRGKLEPKNVSPIIFENFDAEPLKMKQVSYNFMLWYVVVYYLSILDTDLSKRMQEYPWYYGYDATPSVLDSTAFTLPPIEHDKILCEFPSSSAGLELTAESHFKFLCSTEPSYFFPTRLPSSNQFDYATKSYVPKPYKYLPISTSMLCVTEPRLYSRINDDDSTVSLLFSGFINAVSLR